MVIMNISNNLIGLKSEAPYDQSRGESSALHTRLAIQDADIVCLEIQVIVLTDKIEARTGDIETRNVELLKVEETKKADIGQLNKQIEDLISQHDNLTAQYRIQEGELGQAVQKIGELDQAVQKMGELIKKEIDRAESKAIKENAMIGACVLVAGICAFVLLKKSIR